MAMPKSDIWNIGRNILIKYTFLNENDELPMHQHEFAHSSIVMEGIFEILLEGKDSLIRTNENPPMMFKIGTRHGFRAKSAGAMILNIQGH